MRTNSDDPNGTAKQAKFNSSSLMFKGRGKLNGEQIKLRNNDKVQPIALPHRHIPCHVRKPVEEVLAHLEDLDIIEQVGGPMPGSPL